MFKKIALTVLGLLLLLAVIGGAKAAQIKALIDSGDSMKPPPSTVTATVAQQQDWQGSLQALGSVVAVQGITVSSESPGIVQAIRFESGELVKKGQLLLVLDASVERAQLASARTERELAKVNLARVEKLHAEGLATTADLDAARARAEQGDAQVANMRAMSSKKSITAPFAGRLGIRQVDLGQYVSPGTPLVVLNALDRVYVDFQLPQQDLAALTEHPNLKVEVTCDGFAKDKWTGEIKAVDARVDEQSRNVMVRAELDNPSEKLRPGMFVNVRVLLPRSATVVVIPATAVNYAPYGDSVYVLEPPSADAGAPEGTKQLKQTFVRLGERRGDLVAVTRGLAAGQSIVSSGGFKVQNGAIVNVTQELEPDAKANPEPEEG